MDGDVRLREGDTWMILRRHDEDVGFVHRTRTQLESGWLTEYEMLLVVEVLGKKRPVDVSVKARLDAEAYLNSFDAEIRAGGRKIAARGDVHSETISLVVNPTSDPIQRTIALKDRPRLATHSFHQLLGREDLQPGDRFRNAYFDPTSLGMQAIVMEYVGRENVDVFDQNYEAYHLKQTVGGETYDVYVDGQGELLIQEFPFEIVGARVQPELGRSRAAEIRRRADTAKAATPDDPSGLGGAGLEAAFEMLGVSPDEIAGGADEAPDQALPRPDASMPDTSTRSTD
ncbi:MAG: hypothetical protein ABEN55_18900 [Bradymonadaceae bacterium]